MAMLESNPSSNQLIAIFHLPYDKWRLMDKRLDRVLFRNRVRRFYDAATRVGIVKLIPSRYHDVLVGLFGRTIDLIGLPPFDTPNEVHQVCYPKQLL